MFSSIKFLTLLCFDINLPPNSEIINSSISISEDIDSTLLAHKYWIFISWILEFSIAVVEGHEPSVSQLPKQCKRVVSDVIFGRTLSLKLAEIPHGWPLKSYFVPQSLSPLGLLKKA